MSYNYTLKYRKFDQLVDDASVDFKNMANQNQIEPQQLIKVAKRVNYDLGLRINQTKEAVLDVENNFVKVPDDFYTLNYALICDSGSCTQSFPQGTNIQEIKVNTPYQETSSAVEFCTPEKVNCTKCSPSPCGCDTAPSCSNSVSCDAPYNPLVPFGDSCVKPRVFMNCKGDCYELVQFVNPGLTNTWTRLIPVKVLQNPQTIDCDCPNLYLKCENTIWLDNQGFIHTNFKNAKLYINYQGMMEDDDGNLLVPDHDLLNEYYEYALKSRILENLIMNDTPNADKKLQLIEARYRVARNNALSLVNTPNFSELKAVWETNRKAMYSRYYKMFSSYGGL
jgi:hypothetical protein